MSVKEHALFALLQPVCGNPQHRLHVVHELARITHLVHGLDITVLHVKHALMAHVSHCTEGKASSEIAPYGRSTERLLLNALVAKDWHHVSAYLEALGNSNMSSHGRFVQHVLHSPTPKVVRRDANRTLVKLGWSLEQMQTRGDDDGDDGGDAWPAWPLSLQWEWPLPDKESKFQFTPNMEVEANNEGASGSAALSVKLFNNEDLSWDIVKLSMEVPWSSLGMK